MVQPADPFEREARWIGHFKSEEKYLRGLIRERAALGVDATSTEERLQSVTRFRQDVASLLKARGYNKIDIEVPNFRECLRSIGEERAYLLYMTFSQIAHATHSATWLYRSGGLGIAKTDGEFVKADDWNTPLNICLFAFRTPSLIVLRQLGADVAQLSALIESRLRNGGSESCQ
jgi:hypothetical protein